LDYDITAKHRIEGVYSHFLSKLPNDVQLNNIGEQFPGLPGGGQESSRPRWAVAWIASLTPNITNEARFGFSSSTPLFFNNEDFSEGYRLTLPLITNPVQNFLQQGRAPRNYDLIDNLTWVKGSHVFKFGTSARFIRILNFNDAGIVQQYTVGFNSTTNPSPLTAGVFPGGISTTQFGTANNLLGLLTGAVSSVSETFNIQDRDSGFTRGLGSRRFLDYNTLAFYGTDTWRIKPNLSLNLGLRWEYIGPLTERNGLGLMPQDLSLDVLFNPNAVLDFAGKGTGREFLARDLNNFAPNFSFAWDPFKDGKTSVRHSPEQLIGRRQRRFAVNRNRFHVVRNRRRRHRQLHRIAGYLCSIRSGSDSDVQSSAYPRRQPVFVANSYSVYDRVQLEDPVRRTVERRYRARDHERHRAFSWLRR
jgi:hypothetical protein